MQQPVLTSFNQLQSTLPSMCFPPLLPVNGADPPHAVPPVLLYQPPLFLPSLGLFSEVSLPLASRIPVQDPLASGCNTNESPSQGGSVVNTPCYTVPKSQPQLLRKPVAETSETTIYPCYGHLRSSKSLYEISSTETRGSFKESCEVTRSIEGQTLGKSEIYRGSNGEFSEEGSVSCEPRDLRPEASQQPLLPIDLTCSRSLPSCCGQPRCESKAPKPSESDAIGPNLSSPSFPFYSFPNFSTMWMYHSTESQSFASHISGCLKRTTPQEGVALEQSIATSTLCVSPEVSQLCDSSIQPTQSVSPFFNNLKNFCDPLNQQQSKHNGQKKDIYEAITPPPPQVPLHADVVSPCKTKRCREKKPRCTVGSFTEKNNQTPDGIHTARSRLYSLKRKRRDSVVKRNAGDLAKSVHLSKVSNEWGETNSNSPRPRSYAVQTQSTPVTCGEKSSSDCKVETVLPEPLKLTKKSGATPADRFMCYMWRSDVLLTDERLSLTSEDKPSKTHLNKVDSVSARTKAALHPPAVCCTVPSVNHTSNTTSCQLAPSTSSILHKDSGVTSGVSQVQLPKITTDTVPSSTSTVESMECSSLFFAGAPCSTSSLNPPFFDMLFSSTLQRITEDTV